MLYIITFIAGFSLGYLVESFIDMFTDQRVVDNEVYISITEKGQQWLKDHGDDSLDNSKEET